MRIEHWIYTVPLRLRSLFHRRAVEQELDDELHYHLERKVEEYVARGLDPTEARRTALREMDNLTLRKEECREVRKVNFVENTLRDLRYSLRILAKSPGFTAVAVATPPLPLGANAVVFGILNALFLRPIDVPRAESLFGIQGNGGWGYQSYPDYLDLRDRDRMSTRLNSSHVSEPRIPS